jgi:hypothetical protein
MRRKKSNAVSELYTKAANAFFRELSSPGGP